LGIRFVQVLDDHLGVLTEFPEMYPTEYNGLRKFVMKRYPVLVYYRYENDEVVVVALIHGARDQQEALEGR